MSGNDIWRGIFSQITDILKVPNPNIILLIKNKNIY